MTDSEGTFSSRNVFIHDDRNSMLTVTIQQLEMRDSGWYWCGAGQQKVAVHVSVTPQTTTPVPYILVNWYLTNTSYLFRRPVWESPLVVCGVVLLVLTVCLALWKLRQLCSKFPR
ncbi:hypothetical protein cypCar_00044356 [Cyprinus carpio]|nr:hypothetical protein cypCar_00044356 [Cyprinus carpio]